MNCISCGTPVPAGVAFCPNCGTRVPPNPAGPAASPYDPTIAATPYTPSQAPATSYGPPPPYDYSAQNPYSAPPPPYNVPVTPSPSEPYGAALPSSPGTPSYGQVPSPGYTPPSAGYQPGPVPGTYSTTPTPRRRSKLGWIIGTVVVVFLVACIGLFALAAQGTKDSGHSTTTQGTPTQQQTTTDNVPSTSAVVPEAAAILFNPHTANKIDNDLQPVNITSTFKARETVYLTFTVDSKGKDGYIQVRWYQGGQELTASATILKHSAANDHGEFSLEYDAPGDGAAAMYWCTQPKCEDAQLALIARFTVTTAGGSPTNTGSSVLQDADRKTA